MHSLSSNKELMLCGILVGPFVHLVCVELTTPAILSM